MLDYDSDVFVWMGKDVPGEAKVSCFKHVGHAARGVHCKGKNRRDRISFSFVQQGFEPKVFTDAFPRWEPFPREGIDDDDNQISEESEESKSDSDSETESKKISTSATGKSTAAASESVAAVELTDEQKKKMASY